MAVTPDASVTFWYGCNMARHGEIVRLVTRYPRSHRCGCGAGRRARLLLRFAAGEERTHRRRHGRAHGGEIQPGRPRDRDHVVPVVPHEHGRPHGAGDRDGVRHAAHHPTAGRTRRTAASFADPRRAGARAGSCAPWLSRPGARQHRRADAARHDPRADGCRSPAARPRPYVLRHRGRARRVGPGAPGDARSHGRGRRRHAGDRLPFLPPRSRGTGARPPDPGRELDPSIGRRDGAAPHRRIQAVAQCRGSARGDRRRSDCRDGRCRVRAPGGAGTRAARRRFEPTQRRSRR